MAAAYNARVRAEAAAAALANGAVYDGGGGAYGSYDDANPDTDGDAGEGQEGQALQLQMDLPMDGQAQQLGELGGDGGSGGPEGAPQAWTLQQLRRRRLGQPMMGGTGSASSGDEQRPYGGGANGSRTAAYDAAVGGEDDGEEPEGPLGVPTLDRLRRPAPGDDEDE